MPLGACTLNEAELCLVTGTLNFPRNFTYFKEYCAAGSLDKYLKSDKELSIETVYKLIRGIASGMLHLAKVKKKERSSFLRSILGRNCS